MWWRNRNVLLILSIILALPASQAAPYLEPLVLPVLVGLALNFGVNGGLVLALSALMAPGKAIFTGFVLVAAAPPAIAVVPFTALLRGDRTFAFWAPSAAIWGPWPSPR
jgi:predicted Na+-dependent transporter